MTRPTDEQIKALRKGDVVTVRAVVDCPVPDNNGDVRVNMAYGDQNDVIFIKPSEIMTIEPREIKVGDRVRDRDVEGEVKAVCEGRAWVRFDKHQSGDTQPFMCDARLQDLELVP